MNSYFEEQKRLEKYDELLEICRNLDVHKSASYIREKYYIVDTYWSEKLIKFLYPEEFK